MTRIAAHQSSRPDVGSGNRVCEKTMRDKILSMIAGGHRMKRFIEGLDCGQLFPERLEDDIDEDNPVRAIDAFFDALDLAELGFAGVVPEATGRPGHHPQHFSRFISTATSTRSSPHVGLSVKVDGISNSSG